MPIILKWFERGRTITQRKTAYDGDIDPIKLSVRKFWTVRRSTKVRVTVRTGAERIYIDLTKGQAKELAKFLLSI